MDDIDIKSFAGEIGPAAVDQQAVDTNSYQNEADYPVHNEFLDSSIKTEAEEEPVPSKQEYNFKALREEVDRIKAERDLEKREYQLQLDMLRANLQHKPVEDAPKGRMFDGKEDDDYPNVGEIRRAWEERESGYQARIEELEVARIHPDYAEVIEKYTIPLVKQKQHLAEGIQGASNKALFAYELGKMAQQMQQTQASTQKSESAQRIVENSRKPGTLSQAGGQGALSKADYFATMSDQEFMRYASRNLDGI